MELWFSEQHTPNVRFSLKVDRQLFSESSEFQRVDIFDSTEFGRILVLDGRIMMTERDEFIYHEMITHVPLCVNPDIKKVLLVGGGDGGSARELLKYDTIEKIDLVEIDETIVRGKRMFSRICRCVSSSGIEPKICAAEISTEPFVKLKKNPATATAAIRKIFIIVIQSQ